MSAVRTDAAEVLERIEDAFFALDEEWRITYLNAHASELLETDRDEIVGTVVWDAFEDDVETTFQRKFEEAMATQDPISFEEYYPPLETWFEVNAYPSETALSVYCRDVTDRIEREQELERYKEIVETAREDIFVVDERGEYQMVTDSYAQTVGYSEAELIGDHISKVVDERMAETVSTLEGELRPGTRSTVSLKGALERADGETLNAAATLSLLSDGNRVGVIRDVTEQSARRREFDRTRELLEQTEQIADVGGWEIDAGTMDAFWSDHFFDILGIDGEEDPSLVEVLDVCHEADRHTVEEAIWGALGSGDPFDIEARTVRDDGEIRWIHAQGVPVSDGGTVTKVRGIVQDITERKGRERDLELYERVIETVTEGVYAVDEDNRFIMVNDAFCELSGYDRAELLGQPATILEDDTATTGVDRLAEGIFEDNRQRERIEFDLLRKSGDTRPVEAQFEPLEFEDGAGRCGVVRDLTERKQFEDRLASLHRITSSLFRADSNETVAEITTKAVRDALDAPAAWYFGHNSERSSLILRTTADGADDLDPGLSEISLDRDTFLGSAFVAGETRHVYDIRALSYYDNLDHDIDLRSAILTPVGDRGILVAGSPELDGFDVSMRELLEIISTTATAAFNRVEREQRLRDKNEQLAAFSDLNSLIRDLMEAIFDLSSRSEIEELVCDRLASSDSYEFAWIGTAADGQVTVSTEAGVDGYLDDTEIRVDEGLTTGGPTAQAHLTGELQVIQDVSVDERYEAWREHAQRFGYSTSAAIPIVDDGELYGTLNVYSSRSNAFNHEEREALRHFGSIITYALESIEQGQKIQQERNRLEFINRLLRHNLLNSLNVLEARLDLLDGRVDYEVLSELETASDRTREMIDFVETIQQATDVIGRGKDQELTPRDIGSALEARVTSARQAYPEATYLLESAPSVNVVADSLLEEVLDNVLFNAVQHNPDDDPTVWVDVTVDAESVVVSIADDGPGIPDNRTSTLFDQTTKEFDNPDSGFGLYLVKEIVDSYGGTIQVDANEPDGSVFRMRFERP